MSDVVLREAERNYIENPIYDNAYRLVSILRRGWVAPSGLYGIDSLYATYAATSGSRPIVELVLQGRDVLFVDGYLAAYRLDNDENCYRVQEFRGPSDRRASSAVHSFCSSRSILDVSEYDANWAVAESYEGRYHRLMRAYLSYQLSEWQEHPAVVGIIADTYIQSRRQEPHGHPMTAYRGIDVHSYQGHGIAHANNAITIDFGETYKMLLSYTSPSAAVNKITGQCFYTLGRSKTTSNHIGHFLRAHVRDIDKWQKDCIGLPQSIFDALLA